MPGITAAGETQPGDTGTSGSGRTRMEYDAGGDMSATGTKLKPVDTTTDNDGNVVPITYPGYSVRKLSDGSWSYNRLYDCYTTEFNGYNYAVISKYYDTYQQDLLEIGNSVNSGYVIITEEQFNDYFNSSTSEANQNNLLDYDNWKDYQNGITTIESNPAAWYAKYAKDIFDSFDREYKAYDAEYKRVDDWNQKNPDNPLPYPSKPTSSINKKPSEIIVGEARNEYFCNRWKGEDGKGSTILDGYGFKLTLVRDNINNNSSDTSLMVYMMKAEGKKELATTTKYFTDNDGFLTKDRSLEILGIGPKAFEGVLNVVSLSAPKEIRFICDEAFKGSFISSVTFENAETIGNRAFMNCTSLKNVTLVTSTKNIGTEAFRNSGITNIKLPSSVGNISGGAFSFCSNLQNVEFTPGTDCVIGQCAFFNDYALNDVQMEKAKIISIGDGAFAITSAQSGSWEHAVLPEGITGEDEDHTLGDSLFEGRNNLKSVTFPRDLGIKGKTVKLKPNMFLDCTNLEYVSFHAEAGSAVCMNVEFPEDMFLDVLNPEFYVMGPERNTQTGEEASPRKSTWVAYTKATKYVPYRYVDTKGNWCYEISDGVYIMQANDKNELTSCRPVDSSSNEPIDLDIPEKIGSYEIKTIANGALSNANLRERIRSITIHDNSITKLDDSVFEGLPKLQKVTVGNAVNSIGNRTFANCPALKDIIFHTPLIGHEGFTIGEDAFKTTGDELTIHGDIVVGYAPFETAIGKDSGKIDEAGKRICYKSLEPNVLTVMYDNKTGDVVLLDYPKFNELDSSNKEHLAEMEKFYTDKYGRLPGTFTIKIKDANGVTTSTATGIKAEEVDVKGTEPKLRASESKAVLYDENGTYDSLRKEFTAEWIKADGAESAYELASFGPWIDEDYLALAAKEYFGAKQDMKLPQSYFKKYPYSILRNYSRGTSAKADYETVTEDELLWINSCLHLNIPEGITSIDAPTFFNATENNRNVNTYFGEDDAGYNSRIMCTTGKDGSVPGLFSGYYPDYEEGSAEKDKYETAIRGNDRILSITMHDVKRLPDYAFDSCERLQKVTLGPALKQMGKAPFRGCYVAADVEGNDYFEIENGIIYIVNDGTDKDEDAIAGTYTIKECLPARGSAVGDTAIITGTDPKLENVSKIEDGAFEDCNYVQKIDLQDAKKLKKIPKRCFFNCLSLDEVRLPVTVYRIDSEAFGNNKGDLTGKEEDYKSQITVRIPGKEVHIVSDAFTPKKGTVIETYEGTSAADYAIYYKDSKPKGEGDMRLEYISELHTVRFYVPNLDPNPDNELDPDEEPSPSPTATPSPTPDASASPAPSSEPVVDDNDSGYKSLILVKEQTGIEDGKNATPPKKSEIPKFDGYTFSEWKGSYTNVTEDRIVIGVYTDNSGDASRHKVTFYTYDGSSVVSEQYVNEGGDAVAPMPPEREGYKFVAWVPNNFTNITSDLTVLASYELNPANPNGSANPNPSGSGNGNGDGTNATASPAPTGVPAPTATPDPVRKYTVSVSGGSGSGEYPAGAIVAINAYYLDNQVFDRWTSSTAGVGFANPSATSTTFTMPAANVAVTATYKTGNGAAADTPGGGSAGGGTGGSGSGSTGSTSGTTNNGTTVEVTKPGFSNTGVAGATVNGATDNFVIKITEDQAATDAATAALQARYGDLGRILYFPMDISLYDSTGRTKIADTSGISVNLTLPLPDELIQYAGNNKMAAISGGALEDLNARFTTVGGVPCINFTATHFSPYVIYVDTANLTEATIDSTPKTGDPIHPKWFLAIGMACISLVLFFKRDKVVVKTKAA